MFMKNIFENKQKTGVMEYVSFQWNMHPFYGSQLKENKW